VAVKLAAQVGVCAAVERTLQLGHLALGLDVVEALSPWNGGATVKLAWRCEGVSLGLALGVVCIVNKVTLEVALHKTR
jgi:hypothetical protein